MILKKKFLSLVVLFFAITSKYCEKKKTEPKILIVATTTMIGDMVKNIVGDFASVVTLMNAGVDPHAYKPAYSDVNMLNDADLVFHNGLHLEGKMTEIFEKSKIAGKPFFAVSELLQADDLIFDPNFGEAGVDPHIWFDVSLWIKCARYVASVIVDKDSKNADFYSQNLETYIKELQELDLFVKNKIDAIPTKNRVLISAHDAFSYYGRAYKISVVGLQGISTVSECGLRDISNLVARVVKDNIKSIFLETSVPEGPIMAVVDGCIKSGHTVSIGGHLYSDALGEVGSCADTYVKMIKYNTEIIVKALQ